MRALHHLHPQAIAFENLSTLCGEPVALGIEALHDKLVRHGRGGYCFEQNALFAHVLEAIGFTVVPLAARVVWNRKKGYVNPRTHMALLVGAAGAEYLCDVGFGGATLTAPLIFEPGIEQSTPHEAFIINKIDKIFRVEIKFSEGWRPAFEFDLQPQLAVDYAAMNHYVQTWPDSPFRHVLMAGRPDATGRWALGGNELSRYEDGRLLERRRITAAKELKSLLMNEFRIALPPDSGLDSVLERVAAAKAR